MQSKLPPEWFVLNEMLIPMRSAIESLRVTGQDKTADELRAAYERGKALQTALVHLETM